MKQILFLCTIFTLSTASATVDSIGKVKIPYKPVHVLQDFSYIVDNWNDSNINTKMFCITESLYWDEYSSSALPTFERLVQPFEIPVVPGHHPDFQTAQINALYDGKIKVTTNWDDFDNYVEEGANNSIWVHEPKFVVDVSAYNQSTPEGRLEALTMAKLAVISLHYNLAHHGWSHFRLTIEIQGLPSNQSEFVKNDWSRVYATTQWPYSGPSPVAQRYYQELLSDEFCPATLEEAKTFAQ